MLTVDDLNEDEKIEYWRRVETYARAMRRQLGDQRGLRATFSEEGVSTAAQDEVLRKLQGRIDRMAGTQPTPEDFRDQTPLPV